MASKPPSRPGKPSSPPPIKRPGPPIMPSKGERGSKVPSPGKMY